MDDQEGLDTIIDREYLTAWAMEATGGNRKLVHAVLFARGGTLVALLHQHPDLP